MLSFIVLQLICQASLVSPVSLVDTDVHVDITVGDRLVSLFASQRLTVAEVQDSTGLKTAITFSCQIGSERLLGVYAFRDWLLIHREIWEPHALTELAYVDITRPDEVACALGNDLSFSPNQSKVAYQYHVPRFIPREVILEHRRSKVVGIHDLERDGRPVYVPLPEWLSQEEPEHGFSVRGPVSMGRLTSGGRPKNLEAARQESSDTLLEEVDAMDHEMLPVRVPPFSWTKDGNRLAFIMLYRHLDFWGKYQEDYEYYMVIVDFAAESALPAISRFPIEWWGAQDAPSDSRMRFSELYWEDETIVVIHFAVTAARIDVDSGRIIDRLKLQE